MVRPRGWHLDEKHVLVDGNPISASLFDFGLYFFHNAQALIDNGTGPYFYLPKLESHLEARLWNDAFNHGPGRSWAFRAAPSGPRSSSKTFWPPLRWTRFCGSCATIRPG